VDEYLSEKEQIARIREWWNENGWFLIGGAALGALGLFGYNQYRAYQDEQAEQAAGLYLDLKKAADGDNLTEAAALLAQLRSEHPASAYTQQAGLLVARALLIASPERAAEELQYVTEHSDDAELALIARLRLARVQAYREQYDDALKTLTVEDPGQFAGRFNEVKGDIYVALGRVEEARAAYLAAMVADGSELLDRNFLQMKLSDLPGAPPSPAEPEASPAPPADPAAAPAAGPSGEDA
jgi:predicted negative regulator of RcsB-dependent stress response